MPVFAGGLRSNYGTLVDIAYICPQTKICGMVEKKCLFVVEL